MFVYGVWIGKKDNVELIALFHNKYKAEEFLISQKEYDLECETYNDKVYVIEELYVNMRGI